MLDEEAVQLMLEDPDAWEIHCLEETTSTNDAVLGLGPPASDRGVALFAETQSQGRGRRGNTWLSETPGESLLFSCALRPDWPLAQWSRLTHIAALSVKQTIDQLPPAQPQVKWPNDLFLNGRKVCGILVETKVNTNATPMAVIGIGINVNTPENDLPEALRGQATSLREATGMMIDRVSLAASLLSKLSQNLHTASHEFAHQLRELTEASMLIGRFVRATTSQGEIRGHVAGLGSDGELVLHQDDGQEIALTSADEVRLVSPLSVSQ